MAGDKHLHGFEWLTRKTPVIRFDRVRENLSEVDLAALQQPQHFGTECVNQFDLNIGVSLRVVVQEIGKHAFNLAWRSRDLQHA